MNELTRQLANHQITNPDLAPIRKYGSSGNGVGHSRPGEGVSADFAEGAGSPPRLGLDGKPELTEAPQLRATVAEGIPEGFRHAKPGRVAPGGAEAQSPSLARHYPLHFLKSQFY